MDPRELKRIIKLVEESNIEELEIEESGIRIRVRRCGLSPSRAYMEYPPMIPQPMMAYPPAAPAVPHPGTEIPSSPVSAAVPPVAPQASSASDGTTINSPMVGTFYRAPSPDSAPFVQIGTEVNPDTVVCIIEAMKVMNEIKAGKSGKVVEIMVENAQPVEFGQPLFRIV